jgi:energy-coupling factor transporter ATP-binding protein EcfA2
MIVVTNTFIPALKRRRGGDKEKKEKPIADTDVGDQAFYVVSKHRSPPPIAQGLYTEFSSDEEDDDFDDDTSSFFGHTRPQMSFTGADWRPVFNDRMTMFIAGTPGAGKSYLAKQMINLLPQTYDILLFTALEEKDGNFSDLGKERLYKIKMTPEVLSKISLAEIRKRTKAAQTILLFDDVDKIRDSKVQNLTFAIMNDALANGRGHEKHDGEGDLHVICTSHSANDYQKTKYTFENSNYVALFPGTTPPLQMYRMFDKLGLEKELCAKMIKLGRAQKIRSIIVHKVVPMYMIFGNKIMLL